MPTELNCPSCGSPILLHTRAPQIVVCPSCGMTSVVENGSLGEVGRLAVLTDTPSIFKVYRAYKYRGWRFVPCGRVRYDYGQGYWDEWYVRGDSGKETWVSVDEGDIAIEAPIKLNVQLPPFSEVKIGDLLKIDNINMTVVEKNCCTMVGAEGELPFKLAPNDTYNYIDLLGQQRASFTAEYEDTGITCYRGKWVDPFDISEA